METKQICEICYEAEDADGIDHELYDMGSGHLFCNPCIEMAANSHASLTAALDQCVEALDIAKCWLSNLAFDQFNESNILPRRAQNFPTQLHDKLADSTVGDAISYLRAALDVAKKARG